MKIYRITSGDWIAVQLDTGDWFRLTGQKQAVFANQLEWELRDVASEQRLIQNVELLELEEVPCIIEILSSPDGTAFTARAEDDTEFVLQPSEVKTLLSK